MTRTLIAIVKTASKYPGAHGLGRSREQDVSKHMPMLEGEDGGMEVSRAEEAGILRDENSRLKKLVVEAAWTSAYCSRRSETPLRSGIDPAAHRQPITLRKLNKKEIRL